MENVGVSNVGCNASNICDTTTITGFAFNGWEWAVAEPKTSYTRVKKVLVGINFLF